MFLDRCHSPPPFHTRPLLCREPRSAAPVTVSDTTSDTFTCHLNLATWKPGFNFFSMGSRMLKFWVVVGDGNSISQKKLTEFLKHYFTNYRGLSVFCLLVWGPNISPRSLGMVEKDTPCNSLQDSSFTFLKFKFVFELQPF